MSGAILFISKHNAAASSRYRISQFTPYLEKLGWHCSYHAANKNSISEKAKLLKKCRQHDIVFIQRKLFDPVTFYLVKKSCRNLVFDYDDAIYGNDDGTPSKRRYDRFTRTLRACKLGLAGNAYLAAESACPQTDVLPTSVMLENYKGIKDHVKACGRSLCLVWIGSKSTKKYLESHREILEGIGQHVADVKLKVIGDFNIEFDALETECIAWSKKTEIEQLLSADIGVAPMTDDPWTRGKCGLKVIQYMACGLPVISSDCGANAEIIVNGETGFLVDSARDWIEAINKLKDAGLRQSMGEKGRRRVEKCYSTESLSQIMNERFTKLLTGA